MKRYLAKIGNGSRHILTAIAIISGLLTGGFLIWAGLQCDNPLRALLCGTGVILILYSLSLLSD